MSEEQQYDPPSELFMDIVCTGGTPAATCELCGREHFDANGEFMEEGELDDLLAKQKSKPEKYISHNGGIGFGHIDGKQVVWDCPCNRASRFEKFIWGHRQIIASYLKARAQKATEHAQQLAEMTKDL